MEGPTFTHNFSQMNLLSDLIKLTHMLKIQRNVIDLKELD